MSDVGVVVRTLNSARYLAASIESVLGQSMPPGEVIVVDGGSTDDTLGILASFGDRVRVVGQRRTGLAGAAQDGIDAVSRPIVAFQDSDDLWPLERLREMRAALDQHPEWDGVMGEVEHFVSPDLAPEDASRFEVPAGLQPGAGLPSLVVRRSVFDRAGALRDGLSAGDYLEWSDRATRAGVRIEPVATLCLRRRVHLHNFTRRPESKQDYLRAVWEVMARRRGASGASRT
jgi:glycosyltransferase involved in cell wall biosynthesis